MTMDNAHTDQVEVERASFDKFEMLRKVANITAVGPLVVDAMTIRELLAI